MPKIPWWMIPMPRIVWDLPRLPERVPESEIPTRPVPMWVVPLLNAEKKPITVKVDKGTFGYIIEDPQYDVKTGEPQHVVASKHCDGPANFDDALKILKVEATEVKDETFYTVLCLHDEG
jgi:hypothetical protein